VLDGFRYRRFASGAPTDARFRLGWLERQLPEHLGSDFRAGPWRQLIRVLRRGGHVGSARDVAVGREDLLRRIGQIGDGLPGVLRAPARALHGLLGAVAGYGFKPWRLVLGLAAIWLVCAIVYRNADDRGLIAATTPQAASTSAFEPWVYSLDLLLPAADFGQARRFTPAEPGALPACIANPAAVPCLRASLRALTWLETLLGWAGLLTLVACVAGLFDRDRRD
jgi:hypothetical protein